MTLSVMDAPPSSVTRASAVPSPSRMSKQSTADPAALESPSTPRSALQPPQPPSVALLSSSSALPLEALAAAPSPRYHSQAQQRIRSGLISRQSLEGSQPRDDAADSASLLSTSEDDDHSRSDAGLPRRFPSRSSSQGSASRGSSLRMTSAQRATPLSSAAQSNSSHASLPRSGPSAPDAASGAAVAESASSLRNATRPVLVQGSRAFSGASIRSGHGSGEASEDGGASLGRAKSVSSVSSVNSTSSMEAVPFRAAPLGNVRMGYGGFGRAGANNSGGGGAVRWPIRRPADDGTGGPHATSANASGTEPDSDEIPGAGGATADASDARTSPVHRTKVTPKGPSDDWLYRNAPGMGAKGRIPLSNAYRAHLSSQDQRETDETNAASTSPSTSPSRSWAPTAIRSKLARSAGKLGLKPLTTVGQSSPASSTPPAASTSAGPDHAGQTVLTDAAGESQTGSSSRKHDLGLGSVAMSGKASSAPEQGLRGSRSYLGGHSTGSDAASEPAMRTSSITHARLVVAKHPPGPPGTNPPPSPGLVGAVALPDSFPWDVLNSSSDKESSANTPRLAAPRSLAKSNALSVREELDGKVPFLIKASPGAPGELQVDAPYPPRTPSPLARAVSPAEELGGDGYARASGPSPTPAQQVQLDAQAGIARAPAEPSGAMPGPTPPSKSADQAAQALASSRHGPSPSTGAPEDSVTEAVVRKRTSGDTTIRGGTAVAPGANAPRRPALLRALTAESVLSKRSSRSSVSSVDSRRRLGSDGSPATQKAGHDGSRALSPRRSFLKQGGASASPSSPSVPPKDDLPMSRRPSLELRTVGLIKRRGSWNNTASSPTQRAQTPSSVTNSSTSSDSSPRTSSSPHLASNKAALPTLIENESAAPPPPAPPPKDGTSPSSDRKLALPDDSRAGSGSKEHRDEVLTSAPSSALSLSSSSVAPVEIRHAPQRTPTQVANARPGLQLPTEATSAAPRETPVVSSTQTTQRPLSSSTPVQAAQAAARQPRGRQDFEFGEVLGEGSYSTVLEAWDLLSAPPGVLESIPRETLTSATDAIAGSSGAASAKKRYLPLIKAHCKLYAIKVLDKVHILKEKKQKYVGVEKEALSRLIRHPGVITLYWTFQDRDSLYFVLELAPNGELLTIIKKYGSFDVESTRYYAAQVVDTLAGIHTAGVIHRDIKPENILLDAKMRIKVTDFGSAKVLPQAKKVEASESSRAAASSQADAPSEPPRSSSFVGTAEYVSPELLTDKAVSQSSDWWALGCIIFQMVAGRPPFKGANEYMTFQKIIKRDFTFPTDFPDTARDLVERLLQLDPKARLGAGPGGAEDVKTHPFFDDFDWATLWSRAAPEIRTGIYARPPTTASERSASFGSVVGDETDTTDVDGSGLSAEASAPASKDGSTGPPSTASHGRHGGGGTEADDDDSSASDWEENDQSSANRGQRRASAGSALAERQGRRSAFLRRAVGLRTTSDARADEITSARPTDGVGEAGRVAQRASTGGIRHLAARPHTASQQPKASDSSSSLDQGIEGTTTGRVSGLRHSASAVPVSNRPQSLQQLQIQHEQQQQQQQQQQAGLMSWAALLLPHEALLYSCPILHRKLGAFRATTKSRQLLLTDFPRLLCVKETQEQLQVKAEIILALPAALQEPKAPAPSSAQGSTRGPEQSLSSRGTAGQPDRSPRADRDSGPGGSADMARMGSSGTITDGPPIGGAALPLLSLTDPTESPPDRKAPLMRSTLSGGSTPGGTTGLGSGSSARPAGGSKHDPAVPNQDNGTALGLAAMEMAPNLATSVEAKGTRGFIVHTPAKSYHFEDPNGDASHWIRSITKAAQRVSGNPAPAATTVAGRASQARPASRAPS